MSPQQNHALKLLKTNALTDATIDQMANIRPNPRLRLVFGPMEEKDISALAEASARQEIESANIRAAAMSVDDARQIFAASVADRIEGGTAAILRPGDRRALVNAAQGMGMRVFDANLIIALVQESARNGEDTRDSAGLLRLIPAPADRSRSHMAGPILAIFAFAAAILALLIAWVLRGAS